MMMKAPRETFAAGGETIGEPGDADSVLGAGKRSHLKRQNKTPQKLQSASDCRMKGSGLLEHGNRDHLHVEADKNKKPYKKGLFEKRLNQLVSVTPTVAFTIRAFLVPRAYVFHDTDWSRNKVCF
jgi:hypothetical protein